MQLRIKSLAVLTLIGLSIASCETNQSNEKITKSTFNSSQSPSTSLSAEEREFVESLPVQCRVIYLSARNYSKNTGDYSKTTECINEHYDFIGDMTERMLSP